MACRPGALSNVWAQQHSCAPSGARDMVSCARNIGQAFRCRNINFGFATWFSHLVSRRRKLLGRHDITSSVAIGKLHCGLKYVAIRFDEFCVATRFWCRDMVWRPWGRDLKLVSRPGLDRDCSVCVTTRPLVSSSARRTMRVATEHVRPARDRATTRTTARGVRRLGAVHAHCAHDPNLQLNTVWVTVQ